MIGIDEEHELVTSLESAVTVGGHAAPVPDNGREHGLARPVDLADPASNSWGAVRQGHLHEVRTALLERHQAHEVTHGHGFFDEGAHEPGCGDGDIDAPHVVEQPLVSRMVHAGDRPGHSELRLGEQGMDEVDLVVARGRDREVARVQASLGKRVELAGVGQQPLGFGYGRRLDGARRPVDQQDAVPVGDELLGDGTADVAGSGDGDAHVSPQCSRGAADIVAWTSSMRSDSTMAYTMSPDWRTVVSLTTIALP